MALIFLWLIKQKRETALTWVDAQSSQSFTGGLNVTSITYKSVLHLGNQVEKQSLHLLTVSPSSPQTVESHFKTSI